MRISVVVPAHQLTKPVQDCVARLLQLSPAPAELIIAVDGSSPDLVEYLQHHPLTLITLPQSSGPSRTRNTGAEHASGDVLLFLDSDVLAPSNLVDQVIAALHRHPDAAALIGSYDDSPADSHFLSQYRNLQHHYVHQTSTDQVSTFWTGCGAIRRTVFEAVGGFDAARRWMEDIELGYRLRGAGHSIYLIKDLQVKHLKRWTPRLMLWTDFVGRALPWVELLWENRRAENNLNIDWRSRASVIVLGIAILSLLASALNLWMLFISALSILVFIALNLLFYQFLWRKRGAWFTLRAIPWHMLYYALSGAAFGIGSLRYMISQFRRS